MKRERDESTAPDAEAESEQIRARVKRHLKKVVAASVLAGVTLPAAACDDWVVCDPLPPPNDGNRDGDPVVCDPLPPPDGGDTFGDGDAFGDGDGAGDDDGDPPVVCDPIPSPMPDDDEP